MSVTITLSRVEVNAQGYDRHGAYYGAGQSGHSWKVEYPSGCYGGFAQGHVTGRDGRTTRARARMAALAALPPACRGMPVTYED